MALADDIEFFGRVLPQTTWTVLLQSRHSLSPLTAASPNAVQTI
ncbi:hypothetical protein AB0E62_31605 [Streptomyces sp. NPDC038707]